MTPSEIFAGLVADSPRHAEARTALHALLVALARPACRAVGRVTDDELDDVVHDCWVVLYQKGKGGDLPQGLVDKQCERYCRTSLYNRCVTLRRQVARETPDATVGDEQPDESNAPEEAAFDDDTQPLLPRLDAVAGQWIAGRAPKDRDGYRQDWAWLKQLFFDDRTVDEVVDEMLGGGAPASPAERRAARDRLYKRHQRLRERLIEFVDDNAMPDAPLLRRAFYGLILCQRKEKRSVQLTDEGRGLT